KGILYKSRNELLVRQESLARELQECDKALSGIEALLDAELEVEAGLDKPSLPRQQNATVTLESVRDACVKLGKNPPQSDDPTLVKGFFSRAHVCQVLGVHSTNDSVILYLRKLSENGLLESKKYRNGTQFRYI